MSIRFVRPHQNNINEFSESMSLQFDTLLLFTPFTGYVKIQIWNPSVVIADNCMHAPNDKKMRTFLALDFSWRSKYVIRLLSSQRTPCSTKPDIFP